MLFKITVLAASLLAVTSASPLVTRQGTTTNNAPDIVSSVQAKFAFEGPQEKLQKAVMVNVRMGPSFEGTQKQVYLPVHLNQLTLCTDKERHPCLVTKINHATGSISDAGGFEGTGLACQAYQDVFGLVPIGHPFAEDITIDVGGVEGTRIGSVMCTLLGAILAQPSTPS